MYGSFKILITMKIYKLAIIGFFCLFIFTLVIWQLKPIVINKIYWADRLVSYCNDKNICNNIQSEFDYYRWQIRPTETVEQKKLWEDRFSDYCWLINPEINKNLYSLNVKLKIAPEEIHCIFNPIN